MEVKYKLVVTLKVRVEVEEMVVRRMLSCVCVAVEMLVEKRRLTQVEVSVTHMVSVKQQTQASHGQSFPQKPPWQLF